MVAKLRDAYAELGNALQAAAERSNRSFEDVADKMKAKTGQTSKRLLSSINM